MKTSNNYVPVYEDIKVEYKDHMGDDLATVDAARVSFDKESAFLVDDETGETYLSNADNKLIKYLAVNDHVMPFAHSYLKLRLQAPIFVMRQLFKHKIGFTESEVSRRYVDNIPTFYLPREGWRERDTNLKQGSKQGAYILITNGADTNTVYHNSITIALNTYLDLLDSQVSPEQARIVLPVSHMTQVIWTGSLLGMARAYNLRRDSSHAQFETGLVVEQISNIAKELFPVSWEHLTGIK